MQENGFPINRIQIQAIVSITIMENLSMTFGVLKSSQKHFMIKTETYSRVIGTGNWGEYISQKIILEPLKSL